MLAPIKENPAFAPLDAERRMLRDAPTHGTRFRSVLASSMNQGAPLHFSAHALERMEKRGIVFSAQETKQIGVALDRAAAKGARESLLLLDSAVLVASVPNRTIITAMPRDEAEANVFTRIDSAVVVSTPASKTNNHGPDPLWEARTPLIDRSGIRR